MEKLKKMISDMSEHISMLEAAKGQNTYPAPNGKEFGNPVQSYDDKDVDLGGENGDGGSSDEKKKLFLAMMKKQKGGE